MGVRSTGKLSAVQSLDVKRSGRVPDPFYWRFLEKGWIPRGRGRKFRGGTRSRALQRERALAGGARRVSHPFFMPAFRIADTVALDAFNKVIEDGIARESQRGR